jgi:hypothetical protein
VERTTTSPGGLERNQADQGFIVFGVQPVGVMQAVAAAAAERYGKNWNLYLDPGLVSFRDREEEDRRLLVEVQRSVQECAALLTAATEPDLEKEMKQVRDDLQAVAQIKDQTEATAKLRELKGRLDHLRRRILVRRLAVSE